MQNSKISRISFFVIFTLFSFIHILNFVNCIDTVGFINATNEVGFINITNEVGTTNEVGFITTNETNKVEFWGYTKSKLIYKENNDSRYFEIRRAFNFGNDTVVQVIYPTDLETYCLDPAVYLRTIYENGTMFSFKVDFPFPAYNFCPGPNGFYSLDIIFLNTDKLLIYYVNSTDVNLASFYGLVINKEGKIISNPSFLARVPARNGMIYPNGHATLHLNAIDGQARFAFAYLETETQITWIIFEMNNQMEAIQLNTGEYLLNDPSNMYDVLTGLEGDLAFLVIARSGDTSQVFIAFVDPATNFTSEPSVIYSGNSEIIGHLCNIQVSLDYYCFLVKQEENKQSIAEVAFVRSGGVTNTIRFSKINNNIENETIKITALHYSNRFVLNLLSARNNEKTQFNIKGSLLDFNGRYNSSWPFSYNLVVSDNFRTVELNNGYFVIVDKIDNSTWSLQSSKIEPVVSYPYGTPDIVSTYPGIDDEIPLLLSNISITYNLPVILSNKAITIYENTTDGPLIRQIITGGNARDFVSYSQDSMTIFIRTLETTFNNPNSGYYITIEDNGLSNRESGQPVLGVRSGKWRFRTANTDVSYVISKDIKCQFSMTPVGQAHFDKLDALDQYTFLENLRTQLASAVPINPDRIISVDFFKGTWFTAELTSTDNPNEMSSDIIRHDLNILINYGDMTLISQSNATMFIDFSYGFVISDDAGTLFKTNKIPTIVLGVLAIVSGIVYLCLRKKFPNGRNSMLFTVIIVAASFTVDVLFFLISTKDKNIVFYLCIVFIVGTSVVNGVATTIIVLNEIKTNGEFNRWMKEKSTFSAVFTVLAGVDVNVIEFLSSNFAEIEYLNAPFSEKAVKQLMKIGIASIFYKDFPKFFVLVLFYHITINYELIPFLAIVVNFILLVHNIVVKIYFAHILNPEPEEEELELTAMR